jgi:hypothetical protein
MAPKNKTKGTRKNEKRTPSRNSKAAGSVTGGRMAERKGIADPRCHCGS